MSWSYEICGPSSGDRYDSLPVSSVSWAARLNGQIGTGSAVVQTRDAAFAGWSSQYFRNITLPWRRVLVGRWNDIPIFAMLITDREFDFSTGELTLQLAEIGELLRKRFYFPSGSYSPDARIALGPNSADSLLQDAVINMTGGGYWAESSPRRVPVHIGDEWVSGDEWFVTKQSEFLKPWDFLVEASSEEDGLDWVFEPSYGGNSGDGDDGHITGFQWTFRMGRPLERGEHHFTMGAPDSPVMKLQVRDNAAEWATTIFATGEGTGDDRPVRRVGTDDYPEVPRLVQFGQEKSGSKLQRLARGELQFARNVSDTWLLRLPAEYALRRTGNPNTDGVRLGSHITIEYEDGYWGAGQVHLYVIGLSGDGGDVVDVEVLQL